MTTPRGTIPSALALLALLTLLPLLAACASTGGAADGDTVVVVENNLIPPVSLSIHAVAGVGGRSLVGLVDPGETARLRFNPMAGGQQYRFIAKTTAGEEIVSNPVSFTPGATIEWELRSNIAIVADPG